MPGIDGEGEDSYIPGPQGPPGISAEDGTWTADLGPSGTAARAANVVYQNTTSTKRRVSVTTDVGDTTNAITLLVDSVNPPLLGGSQFYPQVATVRGTLYCEIPAQWYYKVVTLGSPTIFSWREMDVSGASFLFPAAPALTLGTANADGTAQSVVRTDSTILAFDATVPVTQAFADAAATGSAAITARRDHKHGMMADPVTAHVAAGDPHTVYALLAGRTGDQTLYGGTGAGSTLFLIASSHGTPVPTYGVALRSDAINYLNGAGTIVAAFDSSAAGTAFNMSGRNMGNNLKGPVFGNSRNTNGGAEGPAAGSYKYTAADSSERFLWLDATGLIRLHNNPPTGSSGSPTISDTAVSVLGDQTSWGKLKENLLPFTDYSMALAAVVNTPLYSFDMNGRHYGAGLVIYDNDVGKWFSHNDDLSREQIPALNLRQIVGYFAASIKELHQRVTKLGG